MILFSTETPVKLACSKETGNITENFTGEPVVLELEVSRDNAEVCWMKDGVKVEESSNITITENGLIRKLTIHFPTLKDSGIYTCNAIDDIMDFKVKITGMMVNHYFCSMSFSKLLVLFSEG